MSYINVSGLDKAEVLSRLYNASKQQGYGFVHARGAMPMTPEQARDEIAARTAAAAARKGTGYDPTPDLHFDYLHGRVMKVSLADDNMYVGLYDRDNGTGAAERALAPILVRS
jgi:hypothetical protein